LNIETIEGIGNIYGDRLRLSGIKIVEDLLEVGATRDGRLKLAKEIDVAPKKVLTWVNQADFLRVRGIGKQYADLLDKAGVNTITDLSGRDPRDLWKTLIQTNRNRTLVKRIPPLRIVESWIERAQQLERIIY